MPTCDECGAEILRPGLCRACAYHREVTRLETENDRLERELAAMKTTKAKA